MTKTEATEWVYDQDEQSVLDQDDLRAAYRALVGAEPVEQSELEGLWSHCCAATEGCGTRPEPGLWFSAIDRDTARHYAQRSMVPSDRPLCDRLEARLQRAGATIVDGEIRPERKNDK
mgnify:FL=1